jgi:hypothetical protein
MKNQRQPTLFASLLESCVSFSFYAEVVKNNLARGMAFLTLLALVSAVSFTVYVNETILPSLNRASDKLPTIEIKNGKVLVEGLGETPVHSTLYADPQKVLRIDIDLESSGETPRTAIDYDYTVVIKKYTIILKPLAGQVHSFGLPYGFSIKITKNWLAIFIHAYLWLILLFVFVGSFVGFWVVRLAQAFVLSIPGLVFWVILRRDLTYGKLFTICIYALAPASLLNILILWLNAKFMLPQEIMQYQWAVFLIVALEYVLGGIIAVQPPPALPKANDRTLSERMF